MKPLKYALAAEGYSEYKFLPMYFQWIASKYNCQTIASKVSLVKSNSSKSKVFAEANRLCQSAFQDECVLFVAGVDLDKPDHTDDQEYHQAELSKLEKIMQPLLKKNAKQIVLFVTVQAIEHWLAYQIYQINNSSRPNNNSLESKNSDQLKLLLYGDKNAKQWKMEMIARSIAEKADFDELAKQSRSFDHFHKQIVTFLASYSSTTKP